LIIFRASEVWKLLSAVKTEFAKFGQVIDSVKKQLEIASRKIDETGRHTRVIQRKLENVEELHPGENNAHFHLP
jgi:DNA recombination protein RmuC